MSETIQHESILKKYLKKYWVYILFAVIFSTMSNLFNLQLPKFFKTLVDEIIQQARFDLIPSFILNLAKIFFLAGVFDLLRTLLTQYLSTNIIYNIRNDMFIALQRQSYSFFDRNRTGNLMSKTTSDVNAIRNFLANQFQNFIKNVITFIIIFYYVWQQNGVMALVFFLFTPPLYALMVWYRKRIRPTSYDMYYSRGMLISTLEENISGVRVIKAFGRQKEEIRKYFRENEDFINKSKKVVKLQTFYGPFSEFLTSAGSTVIVFVGGWLVLNGVMTLGAVVSIFVYFSMVYDPIRNIVNFFNQLAANRAALDRVNEILENRSEIVVPEKPIDPSRVLGDLYIRLLKDERILHEIDTYLKSASAELSRSKDELELQKALRKFEEDKLLPSGVKASAVDSVGFKRNRPLLLSEKDNPIVPVAQKFERLVKNPRFQKEVESALGLNYKRGQEKSFNPVEFIIFYLIYLTKNDLLMENVYRTVSEYKNIAIPILKEKPIKALFDYIEYFANSEEELNRVNEIQKLLYSPKLKEHIQIAKKYDKLLTEKGILESSRKETIIGSRATTNDALSFIRLEKEILTKQFEKIKQKQMRKKKYQVIEKISESKLEQEKERLKIKPIQINTKFEEISWTPVKPPTFNGHVRFKNVYFSYNPHTDSSKIKWALKKINLDVMPGETIALLGATGSGKSTLINLIPRFYDATRGHIYIDGVDIKELDLKNYRKHIGIVAQETFLFSRSIRENICYGLKGKKEKVRDEDMIAVAKIAKIHDFIMSLPDKYDTIVGERGQTLSGGQKQRIAIARALLLDPTILILDDSLSAVDVDTEYEIQQALEYLFKGRTTFIITQRLSTIRNCNRIFILDDGEIVEQGTHEELLELNGIYTKIYNTLFKRKSVKAVSTTAKAQSQESIQETPIIKSGTKITSSSAYKRGQKDGTLIEFAKKYSLKNRTEQSWKDILKKDRSIKLLTLKTKIKEKDKERDEDSDKDRSRERDIDKIKEKTKDRTKDKIKEKTKDRTKDKIKEKTKEKTKDKK